MVAGPQRSASGNKSLHRETERSVAIDCRRCYLAGPQDLEHERQAVCDQLQRVLLFIDAAELLQQTLDQRSALLLETGAQGLHPGVQSPGNSWTGVCRV